MSDVLAAEWIKLRTVRSHWVLAIVAFVFPVAITWLTSALAGGSSVDDELVVAVASATSLVSCMLWGVIGTLAVAQESAHGTLRVTFAAVPRRARVVVAKALLIGAAAAAAIGAGLAASVLGGTSIAATRELDLAIAGTAETRAALVGTVVLAVLIAWLGTGIGMIIRTTPAAVTVLVLWPLLAENLVGGLLLVAFGEDAGRFLPYSAGTQLALVGDIEGAWGSRWVAGAYFGVWVAAVLGIGAWLTERRDA